MGVVGASRPTIFSSLQDSWSKVSHDARELATVLSVAFFLVTIVGQIVKMPPPPLQQKCLGTSLVLTPNCRHFFKIQYTPTLLEIQKR